MQAQVAGDGACGLHLNRADVASTTSSSDRCFGDERMPGSSASVTSAPIFTPPFGWNDFLERRDVLDVDHALGDDAVGLQQVHEVGPAGEDGRVAVVLGEELDRFGFSLGAGVFEGSHAFAPFRASSTRFGVRGSTGTRTPMALATALEMAAFGEMAGGSPRPMTPRLYWSAGS